MNVKLRCVRVTIVAAEEQGVLYECVLSSTQNACAVLYCHLWPARLYHVFHIISLTARYSKEMGIERKMWVLAFFTTFV
jgi:hypothetical protein